MRTKLLALLVSFLFVLPSITIAAAIQAESGGAVNSFFGQNINIATVGKDSILMNKWVRGALDIALGIKVDPTTGKVTTSAFDIAMNLLVFVPVAGWAVRGGLAAGRLAAGAGIRMTGRAAVKTMFGALAKQAGKTGIRQVLRRQSIKLGFKVGNALTRFGKGMQRTFGVLRGFKKVRTVARTYFGPLKWVRKRAGKIIERRLALDLGHKGYTLPHFNYKRIVSYTRLYKGAAKKIGTTVSRNYHIPAFTAVWAGRTIKKGVDHAANHFNRWRSSRSRPRFNNTRSIFRGNSTRYRSSSRGSVFKSHSKRSFRSYAKKRYTKYKRYKYKKYRKRSVIKKRTYKRTYKKRSYKRSYKRSFRARR